MFPSLSRCLFLSTVTILGIASAHAHHNYTRPNTASPARMLALYHFDNETGDVATTFESPGFASPRPLNIQAPSGGGTNLSITTDVAYPVLGPNSVRFNDRQTLVTTEDFPETVEDCTIEIWVKWAPGMTASELHVGSNAGPKLVIGKDNTDSLNDKFGIMTAHGDYRSAPNFTDWTEWDSEPTTNGWWVIAMAIHSTGIEVVEDDHGHEDGVYLPGSYAIFFVNNHPVGFWNQQGDFLGKVDIAGMSVHESNNLYVRCNAGSGILIDDFIWWKEDLTQDGTQLFGLFSDGRPEDSQVEDWNLY